MKILVVDDDRDQLTIRCMLLAHHGFDTLHASGPKGALRMAVDAKPECAVVDVRLPTEEAGLRLIRELKEAFPKMKIFAITGADPERLTRCPERNLIEQIILKGSSSKLLLERLKHLAAESAA